MTNLVAIPTLGNTARVQVSQEIIRAASAPLTYKRKKEIRREAIIAYIKSKPAGERIKLEEFREIGNFGANNAANVFVKTMVKKGLIVKTNLTPRTYSYSVTGGGRRCYYYQTSQA